jgi:hypothetical protein
MNTPNDFDTWLRTALQADGEPTDSGFAARLMAALPPQSPAPAPAPARRGSARWRRHAQSLCLGAAAVALALVLEPSAGLGALDQALASSCLLALLVWWSLPQGRGSGWA